METRDETMLIINPPLLLFPSTAFLRLALHRISQLAVKNTSQTKFKQSSCSGFPIKGPRCASRQHPVVRKHIAVV